MMSTSEMMINPHSTEPPRRQAQSTSSCSRSVKAAPSKQCQRKSRPTTSLASSVAIGCLLCMALVVPLLAPQVGADQTATAGADPGSQQQAARSTQPTVDRQVDTPNSSPVVSTAPRTAADAAGSTSAKASESSSATSTAAASAPHPVATPAKPTKPKQSSAAFISSQKKAALASQQNYDKYQLKATNSQASSGAPETSPASPSTAAEAPAKKASGEEPTSGGSSGSSSSGSESGQQDNNNSKQASAGLAHKKAGQTTNNKAKSSFSLLKKLLPAFMTSSGPMAAAAVAASAVSSSLVGMDRHHVSSSHSRSSQSSSLPLAGDGGVLSKASGKIINLLSSKKSGGYGAVPDHAPFFVRKPAIDRQAGFASGLLSNPLSLGLLFSAPLIPSLLLTPLAIAGLSPAMSAINNFFGDDEEASTPASSGPLSSLFGGGSGGGAGSSSFANFLQGGGSGATQASGAPGLALQAMQSILGPPATTEKPLFNPGMFASQGIQNAMGSLASAGSGSSSSSSGGSSSSSSGSGLSQPSNSPMRNFLGGNLIQTAASMISPSFAAPPSGGAGSSSSSSSSSSTGSGDSDDGPGLMQMASDVFEKVANYMGSDKDIGTASSSSSIASTPTGQTSPLSTLVGLSNFNPFQLSSLLASSPLASAVAAPASGSSSSSSGISSSSSSTQPRAGFFTTLRNVYELFSSSFLRRQEVGDSNECQQRLICELHQRAMNSKLFRRSIQTNLMELAQLDKSLQEQMGKQQAAATGGAGVGPMQARVDADTKAMLNDFLKATNNFRNGRELVNCSKMFPKCSRAMLLSAANAHLADPANGKAIGKFSNLMKKMKFKSNQQHQSQWKLRKAAKSAVNGVPARGPVGTGSGANNQYQATDYLQVVPMSPIPGQAYNNKPPQPGQLAPVDSLKLAQQIMLMSQQQQQQQQLSQAAQQQQQASAPMPQYAAIGQQQQSPPMQYGQQQSSQMYNLPQQISYSNYPQYPQQQQQPQQMSSNIYTDAVAPVYSSTDSPYYMQPQQQQQQQQQSQQQLTSQQQTGADMSSSSSMQSQQPMMPVSYTNSQQQVVQPQQPQNYQLYATSSVPDYNMAAAVGNTSSQDNNNNNNKAAQQQPQQYSGAQAKATAA